MSKTKRSRFLLILLFIGIVLSITVFVSSRRVMAGSAFEIISQEGNFGIDYGRVPSETFSKVEAIQRSSRRDPATMADLMELPVMPHGLPGIAVFDFDRDDDLDIYVSNGPGAANSLYSNQLTETGELYFEDVAEAAGVTAVSQDSQGVCYGDTDNDGDHDLLVLGRSEENRFFENLGNGSFEEDETTVLAGGKKSSSVCAMGDVNGDGLLDVVVGNSFDTHEFYAIFEVPFDLTEHNQLFVNQGSNQFEDVSATSGVQQLAGFPEENSDGAGITWGVSMVDVDLDGDVDIVFADDQGGYPIAMRGGIDRAFVHVLLNDGTGQFVDNPIINSQFSTGSWMGLGFGDFNCDQNIDIFGSNFGDYAFGPLEMPYEFGEESSRWLFGNGDGTFSDPLVDNPKTSSFGWGNAVFDYDNDGDSDIVYHGGIFMEYMAIADNPGILLENKGCTGEFETRTDAMADHSRRIVHGVAIGDLDKDGRVDLVTSSNTNVPQLLPMLSSPLEYDDPLDKYGRFAPLFIPTSNGFIWTGVNTQPGTLEVELNTMESNYGSFTTKLIGSAGLIENGRVNRDGIGAVLQFTPDNSHTVTMPIQGGSSHISQHSLETVFGFGESSSGTLEIIWPGGTKNRLTGVQPTERINFPEIPCSYDGNWESVDAFESCLEEAVAGLVALEIISQEEGNRFIDSNLQAFNQN